MMNYILIIAAVFAIPVCAANETIVAPSIVVHSLPESQLVPELTMQFQQPERCKRLAKWVAPKQKRIVFTLVAVSIMNILYWLIP